MARITLKPIRNSFTIIILSLFALVFLIPFYVMLRNAFATDQFIYSRDWKFWPYPALIFKNLKELFNSPKVNIWNGFKVSAIVTVISTFIQLLLASIAGFGLARLKFKYKTSILYLILLTMMIPAQVTFIPRYIMIFKLGMLNSYAGIIIPMLFNSFAVFMYRQFFLDFSQSIEDSGKIDGLGPWGLWFKLAMPGARSVTAALGAITFFTVWNSFLWPLVVGQNEDLWMIQVIMASFINSRVTILHMVFMGALVAMFPMLLLFFLLQHYMVHGVTMRTFRD